MTRNKSDKQMNTVKAEMSAGKADSLNRQIHSNKQTSSRPGCHIRTGQQKEKDCRIRTYSTKDL